MKSDMTLPLIGITIGSLFCYTWYNSPKKYFFGSPQNGIDRVTVFAHGYQQTNKTGLSYHAEMAFNGFIKNRMITFDFADATDRRQCAFGQKPDVEVLRKVCNSENEVDLVGVSRGAATIINFLGTESALNVRSAIVESSFSDLDSIISPYVLLADLASLLLNKPFSATKLYPNYDLKGIQPINSAIHIPHSIPILLVCSDMDTIIDPSESSRLFNAIKSSGHPNVFLLKLKHGSHAHIIESQDGQTMRNVTHAFYRYIGRPYIKSWADEGQVKFEKCPGYKPKV